MQELLQGISLDELSDPEVPSSLEVLLQGAIDAAKVFCICIELDVLRKKLLHLFEITSAEQGVQMTILYFVDESDISKLIVILLLAFLETEVELLYLGI